MKRVAGERAKNYFNSGWYCAESVFRAMAEAGGCHEPGMERLATGFCSGMARTNGLCGAVAGSLMGIGMYAGRTAPSPEQEMDLPYGIVQDFLEQFRETFGTTLCGELTGCDFSTPEGQRRFVEEGAGKRCREICLQATEMALTVLEDAGFGPAAEDQSPCGPSLDTMIQRHARALKSALEEKYKEETMVFPQEYPMFKNGVNILKLLDLIMNTSSLDRRVEKE